VRIAGANDISRVDMVTQAVTSIGPLVVSDGAPVSAATADATGFAGLYLAGAEIFLAGHRETLRVAVGAVHVSRLESA
jgi:hypothetical protein